MRKPDRKDLNGVVIVNKPSGMTSHDVVDRVRRKFGMRRVGHAGTLDPLATGVLVILIGKGTKLSNQFMGFDKTYRSTLLLGKKTTTADIEGDIVEERDYQHITEDQVRGALGSFLGEGKQVPPMFSAVKVNGKPLYKLARKGMDVEREARSIRINKVDVLRFDLPYVEFLLDCSKGTYVRQLVDDAGQQLGCGACITQIERTKVGPFLLDEAINLQHLTEECVKEFKIASSLS